MLFENAMMKFLFNIDYEVAFSDAPNDERYCNDYIVQWGQRNRIGEPGVKERAQRIVAEILPGLDTDMFFQDLTLPEDMLTGVDWCFIESQNSLGSRAKPGFKAPQAMPMEDLSHPHR